MSDLVVITRPIKDAHDYAEELKGAGFYTLVEPMLIIKDVAFDVPDFEVFDGLLITSANAVEAFMRGCDVGADFLDVPVYCVGKYSAQAAEQAGFKSVFCVDGTGADLLAHILALNDFPDRRFLHLCGHFVAFNIVEKILSAGGEAEGLVVYNSIQTARFSDGFIRHLKAGDIAAVSFFSKRTAQAFVSCVEACFSETESESLFSSIKALSISKAVVECVRVLPWRASHVSETPDRVGMMKLLKAYV